MKRRQFRVLLLVLAAVSTCAAQKAQVADRPEQEVRAHIEFLASDKLEGRRTGEQGAILASGYISNTFEQYGLKPGFKPAKGKASFLQQFPYVAGVTLGKDNELKLTGTRGEMKLETGVNWMPLGYSPTADIPSSPVVFAGYGISSSELKYDDYAGLDVKDKIVLIFDNTPDAGNPHSEFGRFSIHIKASIAKDKGARGIILIAEEPEFKNDRLSVLSYDRTLGETAVPVAGIGRAQAEQLLALDDKGLAALEALVAARTSGTSYPLTQPSALANASAQMKIALTKKQADAFNVIGILEGTDPVLKNEAIIIGAHYDHLGHGGSNSLAANSTEIHHGADDNASGTAAVLELARQFCREKTNKRTIIFMSFAGEEEGLLGSKFYVENPVWPLDKTVAMINMDMVGRLNEGKLTIGGIGTASEWKDLVTANDLVAFDTHNGTPNTTISGSAKIFTLRLNDDGYGPSDHSSFYGKNIPVLFLFTGTHLDYHKPSDTADKINYQGEEKIISYVAAITRSIDRNPRRPTFTTAKVSGTAGRSMGFNISLGTIPSYADTTDGLVLDGVRENSPASKAGLKAGDKITKLNGKEVRNAMDYTYVLGTMKAGIEYEVEVTRGTEKLTLKVIPAPAARRP